MAKDSSKSKKKSKEQSLAGQDIPTEKEAVQPLNKEEAASKGPKLKKKKQKKQSGAVPDATGPAEEAAALEIPASPSKDLEPAKKKAKRKHAEPAPPAEPEAAQEIVQPDTESKVSKKKAKKAGGKSAEEVPAAVPSPSSTAELTKDSSGQTLEDARPAKKNRKKPKPASDVNAPAEETEGKSSKLGQAHNQEQATDADATKPTKQSKKQKKDKKVTASEASAEPATDPSGPESQQPDSAPASPVPDQAGAIDGEGGAKKSKKKRKKESQAAVGLGNGAVTEPPAADETAQAEGAEAMQAPAEKAKKKRKKSQDSHGAAEPEEQKKAKKKKLASGEAQAVEPEVTKLASEQEIKAAVEEGEEAGKLENQLAEQTGEDAVVGPAETRKGTAAKAFQRVKAEEWLHKKAARDNSYQATFGSTGWGAKAQEVLGQVRGKDFRHEKTKKKRGSYRGGVIDNNVNSFKFESDDD